ncbi:hypothetical protein D3C86_1533230 [compost metagenome]
MPFGGLNMSLCGNVRINRSNQLRNGNSVDVCNFVFPAHISDITERISYVQTSVNELRLQRKPGSCREHFILVVKSTRSVGTMNARNDLTAMPGKFTIRGVIRDQRLLCFNNL